MKNKFLFFFLIFLLSQSCLPSNDPVEDLFASIDKTLKNDEKETIDSCKQVSCWMDFIISTKNMELLALIGSLPPRVDSILGSKKIHRYKELCLFIGYCKHRSGINYDFSEILKEIDQYNQDQTIISENKREIRRINRTHFVDSVFQNIQINDSLILTGPTELIGGIWRTYYWRIDPNDEILKIKGIVVGKETINYPNNITDHSVFYLKIRVLSLNKHPCELQFQMIDVGSIIKVDLYSYERNVLTKIQ